MEKKETKGVYAKVVAVMQEIGAVTKSRMNLQQKYPYRGIDDFFNELHPIMAKHGLVFEPSTEILQNDVRVLGSGTQMNFITIQLSINFADENGQKTTPCRNVGVGMDSGDKAVYKAIAGAVKYFVQNTFSVPTEEMKDPEDDRADANKMLEPKGKQEPKQQSAAAKKAEMKQLLVDAHKSFGAILKDQPIWAEVKANFEANDFTSMQTLLNTMPNLAILATERLITESKKTFGDALKLEPIWQEINSAFTEKNFAKTKSLIDTLPNLAKLNEKN